jgi:hypothetical protein
MPRAYLSVTIDCECDKGPRWRSQRPLRFRGIAEGVGRRLQPLFRAYRAKPTYLLSPEVLDDERSVDAMTSLDGDRELGTHLHGEYAEPGAVDVEVTREFQRDYPPEVEQRKLYHLTQLFRRAFGRQPRSFRAGRFGIGPHSLGILDALGYDVESSVTPYVDWSSSGARGLSFVGAPTQPYHPDPGAPARRGSSRLLEVPVTIRPPPLGRLLARALAPRWLRPSRGTARGLVDVARAEIKDARASSPDRPVVLNAMFHNVEVIPGASPYAATEAAARGILSRVGALLAFAARENIRVVGLADLPEVLASRTP